MLELDKILLDELTKSHSEALASVIESLLIKKIAILRKGDFRSFAKSYARHLAYEDPFDIASFPEADGLLDMLELTKADSKHLEKQMKVQSINNVPEFVFARVKSLSSDFEKKLKRGWAARDAQELDRLTGFKARQEQLWGKAFSRFRLLILCCREIGAEQLIKMQQGNSKSDLDWSLQRLHARGCLVANEASALVENGFAHGAMARWRTLYEIEVVALTLQKGGKTIVERFRDHAAITQEKDVACYEEHAARLLMPPFENEFRTQISREHASAVEKYGTHFRSDYGWAFPLFERNPNLSDLATLVDRKHLWPFQRLANMSVHGGTKSLIYNIGLLEQQDILLAGASNAGHADPIQLTAESLATLTGLLFRKEFGSVDKAVIVSTLRKLADQTSKEAMKAHRRQIRYFRKERKTHKPELDAEV